MKNLIFILFTITFLFPYEEEIIIKQNNNKEQLETRTECDFDLVSVVETGEVCNTPCGTKGKKVILSPHKFPTKLQVSFIDCAPITKVVTAANPSVTFCVPRQGGYYVHSSRITGSCQYIPN